jgi:hypothetical protein
MLSFRFRIRTLLFLIWMTALLMAGAIDVFNEYRNRNAVTVVNERVGPDGSITASLLFGRRVYYYLGPLPLGPCPVAVFSGATLVASTAVWLLRRRTFDRSR